MSKTEIDAVRMVRQIRDAMHERTESMTAEEFDAYIRSEAEKLQRKVEQTLASTDRSSGDSGV